VAGNREDHKRNVAEKDRNRSEENEKGDENRDVHKEIVIEESRKRNENENEKRKKDEEEDKKGTGDVPFKQTSRMPGQKPGCW
jgi:hypothetical protein